mgnify:CR=1 FL=1
MYVSSNIQALWPQNKWVAVDLKCVAITDELYKYFLMFISNRLTFEKQQHIDKFTNMVYPAEIEVLLRT